MRIALNVLGRLVETALIVLGVLVVVWEEDDQLLEFLLWWMLLAFAYILVGGLVLRSTRHRSVALQAHAHRLRLAFPFALITSMVGLTVGLHIAWSDQDTDLDAAINFFGGITMVFSWLLLHSGYARRYAQLLTRHGGGLRFPVDDDGKAITPTPVDLLYFAFGIGATFSTSDVQVTSTPMRWHVMTQSILSFFYNAAVVAFAITVLRGT
ncbi:DUF1345 domain-containing protein [Nakamurella sp. YIM 132087]|uniref:DUF1345 domain-containing protein n=1 Tax=Nakamurella alba TaxID=2665158 RepID=A0A7K1FMZ5_9ACTN|nr:DUF1345 domain-containing protein [Nakamurella alba]MTD15542.1 DUF1345 domain-containing protein [Nakamurella alba]